MVEKTVLPCGLTVISENFTEFPSFALSYSLKSGSRAENLGQQRRAPPHRAYAVQGQPPL